MPVALRYANDLPPVRPDQSLLLPCSLKEWLPEHHLVHFICDAVDVLDLQAFHARNRAELQQWWV